MNKIKNFIKINNLTKFSVERNLLKYNNKFYNFSNNFGSGYEANKSFINNNLHNLLNIGDESDLYMLGFDEVNPDGSYVPF